jgi:membrane protease subunit HflK
MPWSNQGGGGPWGSGGKGPWGAGPQSSGPNPPDLEELLRRTQDRVRRAMPGGFGGRGLALLAVAAVLAWGASGFFTVAPDELGVVLRFGAYNRDAHSGVSYHLPFPIETVLTPKVTTIQRVDVGTRVSEDTRRGSTTLRNWPEESLMLTGDENIVDVDFTVLWRIKQDTHEAAKDFLFNIRNPEDTVKAVAESAMREIVGRSEITPLVTGKRDTTESAVQDLIQRTLDSYNAGIQIYQVKMGKADPPEQVIAAFRDVQAAQEDRERLQNEAQTYFNQKIPEAKGRAARITQEAEAYREQTVAEAKGQTSRYLQVLEQYQKAPQVTRERLYLETMERVIGSSDKIFLDSKGQNAAGVLPYLPLSELGRRSTPAPPQPGQPQSGGRP